MTQTQGKRNYYILGWLILIGPMAIVIGLFFAEGLPWVEQQSEKGAIAEALSSNSRGKVAMNKGNYKEAGGHFLNALKIKEDFAEPHMNLGILYHKMGDDVSAITSLKKAISLSDKKKDVMYNNLGMIYAAQADYDTARYMFYKSLETGINPAPIWRNIAKVEKELGNWDKVIEAYHNAIELRPTTKNLYHSMLIDAKYAGENDHYIDSVNVELETPITEQDLAPYDTVIVNQFLSIDEQLAEDYKDIALAYEKTGELNNAIRYFNHALEIRPRWGAIHNRLGIIYAKNDMLKQAEKEFRRALKINPRDANARENLEMLMSKSSGN